VIDTDNLKVFGSKKTKGHKQDIHYFLSSDTESGDFAVILFELSTILNII
jgi:hypothetical protein